MSRFFVSPADIDGRYIRITDKNDIHHMKKVLRLKSGDQVDVSDGDAWEYRARIEETDEKEVLLLILDKQKFAREPATRITLYQGIPKGSKMEEIIQKSVELGVDSISPVFMERTVVVDKGNFGKKLSRWQKIADEAVKQCRRGMIPEVRSPIPFSEMSGALSEYDLVIFPYENEEEMTIKELLRERLTSVSSNASAPSAADMAEPNGAASNGPDRIAIIIGPEGGFSEKEAKALADAGIRGVSLGKTILRTETAGPAAIAMTMYELEL